MAVFYFWAFETNGSPDYAPDASLFWMLPPL